MDVPLALTSSWDREWRAARISDGAHAKRVAGCSSVAAPISLHDGQAAAYLLFRWLPLRRRACADPSCSVGLRQLIPDGTL
jgi:hypothetical protein